LLQQPRHRDRWQRRDREIDRSAYRNIQHTVLSPIRFKNFWRE
jgi:hypothetical protein